MPGTLHIFRRNVSNGPALYQVNYTQVGKTFAKVLDSEHMLRDFLMAGLGLSPSAIDEVWSELRSGTATIQDVELTENQAAENGMIDAPSDF